MAITNVTPVANSVINPGDSFSFDVDDTYTSMVIQVVTATSTEQAYNSGSGGAQSGYTVSVSSSGGTDTFTVARDAGWDLSPQQIYVTEDESGASVQTGISYVLANTSLFPQGVQPYNSTEGIPADSFLALSDSPSSYSGEAGKVAAVNATEDGVEFVTVAAASGAVDSVFGRVGTVVAVGGDYTGSQVVNTPAGNIVATNVQGAINELDVEKAAGPGGATDDAIAVYDGTTGRLLKDSTGTIAQIAANTAKNSGTNVALGSWTKGNDTIGATAADSFDVDNATIASITAIRILASNPLEGANIDTFCAGMNQTGTLILQDISDPGANALVFDVTAHILTASVYWDLTVTNVEDHGTNWATSYSVQFVPAAASGGFTDAPDAALFTERADHVNTPATGKGELWLGSGTAPPTLIYTDEAGADKTIAAGVTSGNAAQFLAVNSGGTDFEFVKQYHYVYIPITFAGAATGTYYGHPANAFWTYTGNNIARGTTQGSPTTPNYMTSPSMAFAGKVVQVTGFYNHLVSTYGGDVELWKTAYTDDSATATMTEMGPGGGFFNIPTTGHTSGRNYDWSTAISSNNTFAAGDDLEILYWQDTVGVIRGSITLTCEVT